jgi:hypothetical protein
MDRMTKLLLLAAGCLAVTAIAYWQSSSEATSPAPPAVAQLKPAVAPANRYDVAPMAPSPREVAPAPAKKAASVVTRKAPARVERRDPPAVVTVERRDNALPPSTPELKAPAPVMTYEQRVANATSTAGEDSDRALLELQRVATVEPGRPEAHEAMAGISLRKRDYAQARDHIGSALARGGKATFMLIHDHSRGNFDAGDTKSTCVGELRILADGVRFEAVNDGDRFSANWADVKEAGANKFFGSGIGGFHVTTTAAGKYKNFNLAPESKDKAEGKLILDLLNDYARRSDRTK